jgi:hypothetical protein
VLPALWSSLRNLFLEIGSSLDPSGGATADAGSWIDPDGKPQAASAMDPTVSTDTGSSLDPNG